MVVENLYRAMGMKPAMCFLSSSTFVRHSESLTLTLNLDRMLQLCLDVFLVREAGELALEEVS